MRRSIFAAALLLTACVLEHGPGLERDPDVVPALPPDGITLVVLGDAGAPTRTASRVAERLGELLAHERAAERTTVVLWAGDNILPDRRRRSCPEDPSPWDRRGSSDLAAVVHAHVQGGGASFAVPGEIEWQCNLLELEATSGAHPWSMPAPQYTVAVGPQGQTEVTRTCNARGCTTADGPGETLVELVMVDAVPWIEPGSGADEALVALDHLLASLTETADEAPPRILVSHLPVEAAGVHGSTALRNEATFHTLYPPLAEAIQAGMFVGVLAAHDRATYVHPDLTNAIKRSDKTWLAAPLWQVVAGAASRPIGESLRLAPRMRYFTSTAYEPLTYAHDGGFAVVRIDGNEVRATVHDRGWRWETSQISMPLVSVPHPAETESPPMEPCLRCEPVPAPDR